MPVACHTCASVVSHVTRDTCELVMAHILRGVCLCRVVRSIGDYIVLRME